MNMWWQQCGKNEDQSAAWGLRQVGLDVSGRLAAWQLNEDGVSTPQGEGACAKWPEAASDWHQGFDWQFGCPVRWRCKVIVVPWFCTWTTVKLHKHLKSLFIENEWFHLILKTGFNENRLPRSAGWIKVQTSSSLVSLFKRNQKYYLYCLDFGFSFGSLWAKQHQQHQQQSVTSTLSTFGSLLLLELNRVYLHTQARKTKVWSHSDVLPSESEI